MSNVSNINKSISQRWHPSDIFKIIVGANSGGEELLATGLINEFLTPIYELAECPPKMDVDYIIFQPSTSIKQLEIPVATWMQLERLDLKEELIVLGTLNINEAESFIEIFNMALEAGEWQDILIEADLVGKILSSMLNFNISLIQKLTTANGHIEAMIDGDCLDDCWKKHITSATNALLGLMNTDQLLQQDRLNGDKIMGAFILRNELLSAEVKRLMAISNVNQLEHVDLVASKPNNVVQMIKDGLK